MRLLKYINPIFLFNIIFYMLTDLNNYIYYNSQIAKFKKSGINRLHNLKIDAINRIYTAVNMPPEILMAASDKNALERQEKELLGAHLTKLEKLMQDYNLYELIKYNYRRFKTEDYYAYKVWISFRPRAASVSWVIWITFYFYYLTKFLINVPWMEYAEKLGLMDLILNLK